MKKEMVMHLDMPWEGDGCDYYNIMNDDGLYRMYYLGCAMHKKTARIPVFLLKFGQFFMRSAPLLLPG